MRVRLTIFFSLLVMASQAQLTADTVALIEKILSRYTETSPGGQLAISRNGKVIYSTAKGLADLEHHVPLTTTSRIEAGSVSKQFTAAAILLLQQQGRLSVEDDVRKYVPELPDYGHTIMILHLMHHTSGLKDWGSIAGISGWPRTTKAYNNDDALEIITRQKTLNNKPGDEYIYSNSGYTLMVHIVQRVSGMTFADFTQKHLIEPAGMTRTLWRNDFRKVVPDRAIAYAKRNGEYYMNMPFEDTHGHGALLTTAEDLLKWNDYYLNAKPAGVEMLQQQLKAYPLNNGKQNLYTAGLVLDLINGWVAISHTGATASYRSNLEHFPNKDISFAWLSNNSDISGLSIAVRNLFVVDTSKKTPAVTEERNNIDIKSFHPFTGAYHNSKTGNGFRVYMTDTSLMSAPSGRLVPVSNTIATMGRAKVIFFVSPRRIQFITASGDTLLYMGADSARTTTKALQEYAGSYSSEETESKMQLVVKNGKLYHRVRNNDVLLTPVYKDGFSFAGGDLYFTRNQQGEPDQMFISIDRARKVRFSKIK